MLRKPIASGSFYPSGRKDLEELIDSFPKSSVKKKALGAVVPHAGYVFSGKVTCKVYSSIKQDFDTIVLIGPNHNGLGEASFSTQKWTTPLGICEPDMEFEDELIKLGLSCDNSAQGLEHSLEVQLPLLQHFFKNFRIVPISINPYHFDAITCEMVGKAISLASKKISRSILIIASSDFTHYGSMYGYEPFGNNEKDLISKIKKIDTKVIDKILSSDPAGLIDVCEKESLTICGYGAIAAMLFALPDRRAELVDYDTSFSTSKNKDAIVGYAGIIIK